MAAPRSPCRAGPPAARVERRADPELVPVRYGRMLQSPFTFYRGAALNMAADLASTPVSGLRVQACGDCHLSNFGAFATPERRVVVDINDFDETLPAPWEWDVKRLAASFVLASRDNGSRPPARARRGARLRPRVPGTHGGARRDERPRRLVREHGARAGHPDGPRGGGEGAGAQAPREGALAQRARARLSPARDDRRARADHQGESAARLSPARALAAKPSSPRSAAPSPPIGRRLPEHRRLLLDRYELVDIAIKVVGVGSVGTRCVA